MIEFIRNPPTWLLVIGISVLSAHALDKVIDVVNRHKGHNGLVPILELFVIFVLGFLAIHAYYEGIIKDRSEIHWYDKPFALVGALVFYALGSMVLYVALRAQDGRTRHKRHKATPR